MATTVVGVPLVVANVNHPAENYKQQFRSVGIAEIVFGSAALLFEVVAFALWVSRYGLYTTTPGIWFGFCITGGLAIGTSNAPSQCNVVGGMVLAIISLFGCFGTAYAGGILATYISWVGFNFIMIFHVIVVLCAIGQFFAACVHIHYCRLSTCA